MKMRNLKHTKNDHAISPVIGTILMVAATVIIAGAVYAAVNAYNGKAAKAGPDASFKAQAMDTDGDGLEDTIKVTYLSGPTGSESVTVSAKASDDGASLAAGPAPDYNATTAPSGIWDPGDYQSFTTSGNAAETAYVTVRFGDSIVLDQTLALKE